MGTDLGRTSPQVDPLRRAPVESGASVERAHDERPFPMLGGLAAP